MAYRWFVDARHDFLHGHAELAGQIADTERKQDILVKILKEVTSGCPNCKMNVAKRLSQITGIVEAVVIEDADVV
jgi:hypothetical protein